MRNVLSRQSPAGAVIALATIATLSAGLAVQAQSGIAGSAYAPLESQNRAGFGDEIAFTPSGYTPPGIVHPVGQALASQNLSGFGTEIAFTTSGYTPPGIAGIGRRPLASLDQAGFGEPINFTASGYTPPGITDHSTTVVRSR